MSRRGENWKDLEEGGESFFLYIRDKYYIQNCKGL